MENKNVLKFWSFILIPLFFLSINFLFFGLPFLSLIFFLLCIDGFFGFVRYKSGSISNSLLVPKIIKNKIIPFGKYACMQLFGWIFTKINMNQSTIEHEQIHKAQGLETGWFLMYFIYLVEGLYFFLKLTIAFKCSPYSAIIEAYNHICFDQEAHLGDNLLNYKNTRTNYCWIGMLFNNNDDIKNLKTINI